MDLMNVFISSVDTVDRRKLANGPYSNNNNPRTLLSSVPDQLNSVYFEMDRWILS